MVDTAPPAIKGPMGYRDSAKVRVIDKAGDIWEVTRRNANDLVTHNGWKYEVPPASDEDALQQNALAPRKKGQSSQKVGKARAEADKLKRKAADTKKVGAKAKKAEVAKEEPEEDIPDDTFDSQAAVDDLDDELADLEAEEDARGKH